MKRAWIVIALGGVACGKGAPDGGSSTSGSSASGSSASGSSASGSSAGASSTTVPTDPALDPWELEPALLEHPTFAAVNGKPVTIDGIVVRIDGAKLTATKGTSESADLAFGLDEIAELALLGQGFVVVKTASGFDVVHVGEAQPTDACRDDLQRTMTDLHVVVPTPLGETTANGIMSVRSGGWIAKCGTQSRRRWFAVANGTGRAVDAKDITKAAEHKPIAAALLPAWTHVTGPHVVIDTDTGAKTLGGVSLRYRDRDNNFAHPHHEIVAKLGGKTEIADVTTTGRDAEFHAFGRGFVVSYPGNAAIVTQVTPVKATCFETVKALVERLKIEPPDDEIVGFFFDAGFAVQYSAGWTVSCGTVTGRVMLQPSAPYKIIP